MGCAIDFEEYSRMTEKEKIYLVGLVNRSMHRFDGLPVHKICYYHSYHGTEKVLLDIEREIHPRATKTRCGKLSDLGKRQDFQGMTPLHILTCSAKHHLEIYQLLVEKYPENLTVHDQWGEIPLTYAFCCRAPIDVVEFLVESYRLKRPDFDFNWEHMATFLARHGASFRSIQILVDTHCSYFPDQKLDLKNVVMEVVSSPESASDKTIQFLLQRSMQNRIDTLNVRRWSSDICESIYEISRENRLLVDERLPGNPRWLYNELDAYESFKEATTLLELALWKTALTERFFKTNWPTAKLPQSVPD